jgi:hypothetical protein
LLLLHCDDLPNRNSKDAKNLADVNTLARVGWYGERRTLSLSGARTHSILISTITVNYHSTASASSACSAAVNLVLS